MTKTNVKVLQEFITLRISTKLLEQLMYLANLQGINRTEKIRQLITNAYIEQKKFEKMGKE